MLCVDGQARDSRVAEKYKIHLVLRIWLLILAVRKPLIPYHPNAQLGSSCEHPFLHSSEASSLHRNCARDGQGEERCIIKSTRPFCMKRVSTRMLKQTTVFMVGLVCHLIELLCQKLVLILANLPPTCHLHPVFPRPRSRLALEDAPVPLKPLHMHLYLAGCILCIHKICI